MKRILFLELEEWRFVWWTIKHRRHRKNYASWLSDGLPGWPMNYITCLPCGNTFKFKEPKK